MTSPWRTCFRVLRDHSVKVAVQFALLAVVPLSAATIAGKVQLTGTTVKDFSGVVISLESATPQLPPPRRATITQKNKTFIPHVLAIPAGTTVDFPNLDPIFHNAFSSFDGKVFDVGLYPPGGSKAVRFDRPGIIRLFCNIHPAMSAVIVVVNSPWFTVSSRSGAFEITGVPPGIYTLRVYHERATTATLSSLTRGVTVHDDRLDLPVITISETGYLPAPHKNKYGKDYPDQVIYSEHLP
jgi:plastocyanin